MRRRYMVHGIRHNLDWEQKLKINAVTELNHHYIKTHIHLYFIYIYAVVTAFVMPNSRSPPSLGSPSILSWRNTTSYRLATILFIKICNCFILFYKYRFLASFVIYLVYLQLVVCAIFIFFFQFYGWGKCGRF